MAYRPDPDLKFLAHCSDEDLGYLYDVLTKDEKGKLRISEELSTNEKVKKYYPNHTKYWREIAEEIQKFGGNTFMNMFRGTGVLYREILSDVCDKLKINYNAHTSIDHIEMNLILKIFEDSLEKYSENELKEIASSLNIKDLGVTKPVIMMALQSSIKLGGFAAYQLSVIVANAVARVVLGRGLSLATNATITRALGIAAGPIGWAITLIWTLKDIAGPAYRVTIPVCVFVAYLRQKQKFKDLPL